MKRFFSVLALVLTMACVEGVAHADPLYEFTFSGGGYVYQFELPNIGPQREVTGHQLFFVRNNVPGTANGVPVTFYDVQFCEGCIGVQNVRVDTYPNPVPLFALLGPVPFKLIETPIVGPCVPQIYFPCTNVATQFLPGTYAYQNCCFTGPFPVTLTIDEVNDTTVTPEPESVWLLGTGVVAALGHWRVRGRGCGIRYRRGAGGRMTRG